MLQFDCCSIRYLYCFKLYVHIIEQVVGLRKSFIVGRFLPLIDALGLYREAT